MARPRFADGGNDLCLWRIAANTLNKQPKKGVPPAWGWLKSSHLKNKIVTKIRNEPRTLTDSLDNYPL
jgi:hypothetical protein